MATSWREQLDEFKKQSSDIAEMEGRIKELLLENANLKRLLNEVHGEMRQLKEVKSTALCCTNLYSSLVELDH